MKWIALSLIGVGLALILYAFNSDRTSSFDGGSFVLQMLALLAGGGLMLGGIVWIIVLVFVAVP